MMRFFAFIRKMLALDSAAMAAGQIAMDAVNKYMVPRVRHLVAKARRDGRESEVERLQEMLDGYVRYGTKGTAESEELGRIVERVVENVVKNAKGMEGDMDDVAQSIAIGFYEKNVKGETLMDSLARHEVERGPKEFERYWAHIVRRRALYAMREMQRKRTMAPWRDKKENGEYVREHDEDVTEQVDDKMSGEGPMPYLELEEQEEQEQRRQAWKKAEAYVEGRGEPVHVAMLRRIEDLVVRQGKDKVMLKYDVYQPLIRKMGLPYKEGRMHEKMLELRRMLLDAFRADKEGAEALARSVKIASRDFVLVEYRRRFAVWMLGEEI